MTIGNESAENTFKTRQSSLRFHRLRTPESIPTFFETDADDSPSLPYSQQERMAQPKPYNLSMNKTSLFGFLLTITSVGILLFSAGFMVAYITYAPGHEVRAAQPQPVVPTPNQPALNQHVEPKNAEASPHIAAQAAKPIPQGALNPPVPKVPGVNAPALPTPSMENPHQTLNHVAEIERIRRLKDEEHMRNNHNPQHSQKAHEGFGILIDSEEAEMTTPGVPQPPFAIEFGHADTEQTAQDMVQELAQQNLKAEVIESLNENGKFIYHVRSPLYRDYETAYQTLLQLPKPFSLWGTIVRIDEVSKSEH